ncbi:MAG: hypothetical protein GYA50_05460, partial [Eubacteriaceae bacterium]|nr:hypothetical protein [Eubacteriaceae bacterium]
EYYITSGEIFYEMLPMLPVILTSFGVFMLLAAFASSFEMAMIFVLTDSSVSGEKRSFGKMLAFSFKRAFPVMGTTVLLSLIYLAVFAVFLIAAAAIAVSMGIDFSSIMYYEDISSQMQLGIYVIILFVLYLIMLAFVILISIIYSMSIFARVKYKFCGAASLKYARLLTKGKRGKIFGNMLLIALIDIVIAGLLSYAANTASDFDIPFIPFLIQIVITFIGMLVSVFWAVMFINFDNVKGPDIISSRFAKAINIKDAYFQSETVSQDYTYNQNNSQQNNAPVQNSPTDEKAESAPAQSDVQPVDAQTDNSLNGELKDADQPSAEPSDTDDKVITE